MALTITNPTYATQGPSKTGQVLAPNELTNLENSFIGTATITLDGTTTTGTINYIDGTQQIFATGDAAGTITAPAAVEASIIGGTQHSTAGTALAIACDTSAGSKTGFTFYLSAAGTSGKTIIVRFYVYRY